MSYFDKSIFLMLVLGYSINGFSQQDTAVFSSLDEVVITGQHQPQSLKKSVYQVRVITSDEIRLRGASTLPQFLNYQPGFRISNDNTLGISDVILNGMGGNNIKVLVDGIPMADRYDERVSLSQIDLNNVERIEIVEGPMSVSYGSDAMAGVINIITKKQLNQDMAIHAGVREETSGTEYYPLSYKGVHDQNIGISYHKDHVMAALGGTHHDFDGVGGDAYGRGKQWKPKTQWMGYAKVGYFEKNFDIYYRIDGLHETITSRNPINWNNYKATDQRYITHRYLHQLQSSWQMNKKLSVNSFLAYTDYDRSTKTTRHNFEEHKAEPNQPGEDDISRLHSMAFKSTFHYQVNPGFSLQPGIDINHEKADGARIQGSPQINDYALFASAEVRAASFLNVRPGVRFAFNSQYDAPAVTPSFNSKFQLV